MYPYTKTVSNTVVVLIKQFLHGPHTNLSQKRYHFIYLILVLKLVCQRRLLQVKLSSEILKERQTERGS